MTSQRVGIVSFASIAGTFSALLLSGCGGFFVPPTGGPGYSSSTTISTLYETINLNAPSIPPYCLQPIPDQPIRGSLDYLNNPSSYQGSATTFGPAAGQPYDLQRGSTGNTGSGSVNILNLELPGVWYVGYNWDITNPYPLPKGCETGIGQREKELPEPNYYPTYPTLTNYGSDPIACTFYDQCGPYGTVNQNQQFSLDTNLPSTLTVKASSPLTTAYGSPVLLIYNRTGTSIAQSNAIGIAGDGVTATFPFPSTSSGPLYPDMYGTAIVNTNSDGSQHYAGGTGFFAIGHYDTSYPSAYGIAAGMSSTFVQTCYALPRQPRYCTSYRYSAQFPIVSSWSQNQVIWNGGTVGVGINPSAVIAYGTSSKSTSTGSGSNFTDTDKTGTGYALVTNTGSNSVSFINLIYSTVVATTSVGRQPVAAAISPDLSTAYVVNYQDGTISRISLSSYAVESTTSVGPNPTSIDVDASGNLWVGGPNYVNEVNPSSMAVVSSMAISGNITSLAISNALNRVVTTVAANSNGTGGQINYVSGNSSVRALDLTSHAQVISESVGGTQPYASSSEASVLPTPGQLGNGTLVSANYGNTLSISATPTGFIVTELTTGQPFISGTTPGPVRSIAVDPDYGYVYLTVPDDNAVITVPLPPIPPSVPPA